MECLIRKAVDSDIEAIRDLWREINDYHAQTAQHVFRQGESVPRDQLEDWLHSGDNTFFVAVSDGQVAGFVRCVTRTTADSPLIVPRTYMVIDVLVVRAHCRRQGIGSRLIERAHRWAREQAIDQLEIGVWEFNHDARKLYESLGYTTVSRKLWLRLS